MRIWWMSLLMVLGLLLGGSYCLASDLDDGISKFTDDSVTKYDEIGKLDRNINFIKLNAKSQAKVRGQKGSEQGSGGGNMNSVVLGAGGNVRGDIIIIDESKGDKTQVVE